MIIEYSPTAIKQLKKLPQHKRITIIRKIESLKKYPLQGKKLKGVYHGKYSLRSWPYRVIYSLVPKKTLLIIAIEHRQSVYKG